MKECKVHIYTKAEFLDKIKDFHKAIIIDNIDDGAGKEIMHSFMAGTLC